MGASESPSYNRFVSVLTVSCVRLIVLFSIHLSLYLRLPLEAGTTLLSLF
jgi:hypothetical protein